MARKQGGENTLLKDMIDKSGEDNVKVKKGKKRRGKGGDGEEREGERKGVGNRHLKVVLNKSEEERRARGEGEERGGERCDGGDGGGVRKLPQVTQAGRVCR